MSDLLIKTMSEIPRRQENEWQRRARTLSKKQPRQIQSEPLVHYHEADESKLILVKSNLKDLKDGDGTPCAPVALFERHEAHPNEEIFIAGAGKVFEVALTEKVLEKLKSGDLVAVITK